MAGSLATGQFGGAKGDIGALWQRLKPLVSSAAGQLSNATLGGGQLQPSPQAQPTVAGTGDADVSALLSYLSQKKRRKGVTASVDPNAPTDIEPVPYEEGSEPQQYRPPFPANEGGVNPADYAEALKYLGDGGGGMTESYDIPDAPAPVENKSGNLTPEQARQYLDKWQGVFDKYETSKSAPQPQASQDVAAQPAQQVGPPVPVQAAPNNPMSDQWLTSEQQRLFNELYGSNLGINDQTNATIKDYGYEHPIEDVQARSLDPLLQLLQNRQARLEERHPIRNFFDAFGDALPNDSSALGGFGRGYRSARGIREGREKNVDANDMALANLQAKLAERQGMAERNRGMSDIIDPEAIGKVSDLSARLRMISQAQRDNAYGQSHSGSGGNKELATYLRQLPPKVQASFWEAVNSGDKAKAQMIWDTYGVQGQQPDMAQESEAASGVPATGGDTGLSPLQKLGRWTGLWGD